MFLYTLCFHCFFFNDTATTEIYTLSLHDALPILRVDYEFNISDFNEPGKAFGPDELQEAIRRGAIEILDDATIANMKAKRQRDKERDKAQRQQQAIADGATDWQQRSEEHTSELQSRQYIVCRLLLEKKIQ